MSDVVNQANGQNPDAATLSFPGGTAEFPIRRAVDGSSSIDLSTLTRQTGLTALDYGFVNTASTQSKITYIDGEQGILRYRGYPIEQLAEHSTYLEVAWLLIYGSCRAPTSSPSSTRRSAGTPCCTRTSSGSSRRCRTPRTRCRCSRAPSRRCRPTTRTRPTRTTSTTSSSPWCACSRSCRSSRRTRTRRASARRSSTPTTR